jgi:hypothetical protein
MFLSRVGDDQDHLLEALLHRIELLQRRIVHFH